MMTHQTIPIRAEVPWRDIDGNVIVVRPTNGFIYPLNSVATRIWLLSDGTKSVAEIVEVLLEEFEGDAEQIRKDALLFLEELEKASLIHSDHSLKVVSQKKE